MALYFQSKHVFGWGGLISLSFCLVLLNRSLLWSDNTALVPITSSHGSEVGRCNGSRLVAQIPIDHFDVEDSRTFSNRYWINDTFYKSGGPVFLFDTGIVSSIE